MSLIIFGMGYSCKVLVENHRDALPAPIIATTRSEEKAERLRARGVTPRVFPGSDMADDLDGMDDPRARAAGSGDATPSPPFRAARVCRAGGVKAVISGGGAAEGGNCGSFAPEARIALLTLPGGSAGRTGRKRCSGPG